VFLVSVAVAVPVGSLPIVAAAYAARHGHPAITGWTLAANATGALISGLYGAVKPPASPGRRALTVAALALAVAYLPLAIPLPLAGWLVAAAVAGLPLPVLLGLAFGRVNEVSPPNLVTEANAWVITAFTVGMSAASLLAGVLTDHLASKTAVATIVVAGSVITALGALASAERVEARQV
jgi:MFS family permease